MFSFSLTKKKEKVKTKRSASHNANLLRILSGLGSVFKLHWLPKSGAGVHEKCEPQVGGLRHAALCDNDKLAVGFRGAFSLLRFFGHAKK